MPRVSVLMSVYNGEPFLRQAVESILNQTFTDFEFIIVDDGSADGTWAILRSYADPRIRLERNPDNIGLTPSLNKGLVLTRGEYVARMDADDVSLPTRLEKQVAFMSIHSEVGLLGTGSRNIKSDGEIEQRASIPPTNDGIIRWYLIFGSLLIHPSIIFRRALIDEIGLYNEEMRFAQDYELWCRMAQVTRLANLSEPLLLYRNEDSSRISKKHSQEQWECNCAASAKVVRRILGDESFSNEQARRLCAFVFRERSWGQWGMRAAYDLGLVLQRFIAAQSNIIPWTNGLTLSDKCAIVRHISWLAWNELVDNKSNESRAIARHLILAMLKLHLPVLKVSSGRRTIAKYFLGRKLAHFLKKARRSLVFRFHKNHNDSSLVYIPHVDK